MNTPGARTSSVLFVCLGNICRSPTAEGVFRTLVAVEGLSDRIRIDSAGTHAYHTGESPDVRAQAAARDRGIDLSVQTARQVNVEDFTDFDYILAMDKENLYHLEAFRPPNSQARVGLFLDYAQGHEGQSVPDPYFGAKNGFAHVLDLVEIAGRGLLEEIAHAMPGE